MKSFDSKMRKKIFRKTVGDEVMKAAEIYVLTILWTLHEDFGFGAVRLKRFYDSFVKTYRYMRDRYYCEGDEELFGSRTDAYVMKERLKEIGFDYDKEVKELTDDGRKETD
jgi:hypothetical protein